MAYPTIIEERSETPTPTQPPVAHLTVATNHVASPKKSDSSLSAASTTLSSSAEKGFNVHVDDQITTPLSLQQSNPFDTDIEAIIPVTQSDSRRKSATMARGDCQVWPGQEHWKQKAKAAKRARSCAWMASLSRRTRIAVKIAIILLIIGIAVGIGFGISKPLGAPIWGTPDGH